MIFVDRLLNQQGKFSNLRRNYSAMWSQISGRINDVKSDAKVMFLKMKYFNSHLPDLLLRSKVARLFHMNILGKGPDRLKLPLELQPHVSVHRRLPFQAFYSVICHTLVNGCGVKR